MTNKSTLLCAYNIHADMQSCQCKCHQPFIAKPQQLDYKQLQFQVEYLLLDAANDMLRQIKRNGDSKADFYLPPVMEKVAKVLADHLSKSNVVHIKAELAATNLRETIDNNVCDALLMPTEARLEHLLKKSKSAISD